MAIFEPLQLSLLDKLNTTFFPVKKTGIQLYKKLPKAEDLCEVFNLTSCAACCVPKNLQDSHRIDKKLNTQSAAKLSFVGRA